MTLQHGLLMEAETSEHEAALTVYLDDVTVTRATAMNYVITDIMESVLG